MSSRTLEQQIDQAVDEIVRQVKKKCLIDETVSDDRVIFSLQDYFPENYDYIRESGYHLLLRDLVGRQVKKHYGWEVEIPTEPDDIIIHSLQ